VVLLDAVPKLIPCSATADLSGCSRRICRVFFFNLVSNVDLTALTEDAVYSLLVVEFSILQMDCKLLSQ
jgi:hypothetical protein